MKIITESEMNFGKFDEENLFHIEDSKIYKDLGSGIKTVEFILKWKKNEILFLEAKTTCPNSANKNESMKKTQKFEEYYSEITEKFMDSLQVYLAAVMGRYPDLAEIGAELRSVDSMKEIRLKFILVVKNAKDITWLAGPLAELKARLLQVRKIWGVEVAVLNEELAKENKLTC